MHFEYEITVDDYVASQVLYYKLKLGRKWTKRTITWFLLGFVLFAFAWTERSSSCDPILLAIIGVSCIYCGVRSLFPARYLRRAYHTANLAGKKYNADVNEDGFEVAADFCTWRIRWPGVKLKGEDQQVFILYSGSTLFMFGKNYLDGEQQQELRRLAGLPTPSR